MRVFVCVWKGGEGGEGGDGGGRGILLRLLFKVHGLPFYSRYSI